MIIVKIFGMILLTDFLAGLIHWWEDAYGNPKWKWFGKAIVIPNIEHHRYPRKFLKGTTIGRIKFSVLFGLFLLIILYPFVGFSWELIFVLVYGSFGNEIHAITHRTDKENGKIICFIQKSGLLQSRRMHGLHHSSPYDCNYCVMTNYLNPVLTYIRFWERLEIVISWFGITPIRNNNIREGV
jgi:ubiquitin-conjugating enzyme E2 variant